MGPPSSSESVEGQGQPYSIASTSLPTAEQLATNVKPLLTTSQSASSTPRTTSSATPPPPSGGQGQGGFLATVRNAASAATDMLGINSTLPTSATANSTETDPTGTSDSNGSYNVTTTTTKTDMTEDQDMAPLPETMTMETFQMNGGNISYLPSYETDSNHSTTVASQNGGPGSFPESLGADGQEYGYHSYCPEDSTNSQHDDDEYSAANINFVYANEKRFSDFHSIFRSVPEDEKLIEDYGCALQKEILVQGRLYITENHVCFNANIFGWVTNLVIAFSEITAIEKRLTAFVIPNAISIVTTTNTKGHFFASFLSRDAAHDLLMAAWRKSFPCAANASACHQNTYFRHNRSNGTLNEDDDAASFISARAASDSRRNRHRRSSSASQNWTADEADWDEIGEEIDGRSSVGSRRHGPKIANVKKIFKDEHHGATTESTRAGRGRSQSELPPRPTSFDFKQQADELSRNRRAGSESAPTSHAVKTNGVATVAGAAGGTGAGRAPTTCKCSKDGRHYAGVFMSETYPGTVEGMWKLLFDSDFNKNFLTNEAMKGADVQEEAWKPTSDGTSTKVTKYTKWLGMPIGPKTTKAILTDVCEHKNFDDYVSTVTTTSTPDVPSGGSFTTKCRTCITWAGPNQVQIVVTGAVEFTKTSWIKGQIEKGAAEGMGTHYKELNHSIRKHIAAHPEEFDGAEAGSASQPSNTATNVTDGVASSSDAATPSQERPKKRHHDSNTSHSTAEKKKSEKAHATVTQQSSGKNSTGGGAAGLLSGIVASLTAGPDGEGASHMALMIVLILVMLANIYIWFQISSVTSQIEKIQGDIYAELRNNGRPHSMASSPKRYYSVEQGEFGDRGFTKEQEEAMWLWLTEREDRHRRYQRSVQKERNRARSHENNDNDNNSNSNWKDQTATSTKSSSAITEERLQAKINELQHQLESLERAMEQGSSREL
ncbi:hypothetical protein FBU30_010399 [Linnemannia zychae]|nr:hypothetical protein FBU30_010399 [Linnemannia zychae]